MQSYVFWVQSSQMNMLILRGISTPKKRGKQVYKLSNTSINTNRAKSPKPKGFMSIYKLHNGNCTHVISQV